MYWICTFLYLISLGWAPVFQVTLNGALQTDSGKPVAATRVSVAGGQSDVTDSRGQFRIILSGDFKEGERVIISIEKKGWIINYPLDGEWNLPNVHLQNIQPLKVVIVPRGSKALWTHARIEKLVANLSDEIAKLKKEGDKPRPIDFSFYLSEWADKYGFTPDQVKEEFDKWANSVEHSEDYRTIGLREFYKKNFAVAAENFDKAALKDQERSKRLQEQAYKTNLSAYENWRLSGNSLSSSYRFREALERYIKARSLISQEKESIAWREIEILIAITKRELGVRVNPKEGLGLMTESTDSLTELLKITPREKFPQEWASAKLNLANVLYSQGIEASGEDGTKLLNESISTYKEALTIYTSERFPQERARVQNNITNVLRHLAERVRGEQREKLLQEAIETLQDVLKIYTRERFPQEWAGVQNSLGNTLSDQAELVADETSLARLSAAADAYKRALEVYTVKDNPEDWAKVKRNLSLVLLHKGGIVGGKEGASLVSESIDSIRDASKVITYEKQPQGWARLQSSLGAALGTRGKLVGGKEGYQLLEESKSAFRESLKVYTFKESPQSWAEAERNIAESLINQASLAEGELKSRLLGEAVATLNETFNVYKQEKQPQEWARVQYYLGHAYEELNDWNNALVSYRNILSVYPNFTGTYQLISHIYLDVLHDYAKALEFNKEWVDKHPDDISALGDLAEKYFTTGRFTEAQELSSKILSNTKLSAGSHVALRFIHLASLLGQGLSNSASSEMNTITDEIAKQPVNFRVKWGWGGTLYFIEHDEKLLPYRAWLIQIIHALQGENRDAILNELKNISTNPNARVGILMEGMLPRRSFTVEDIRDIVSFSCFKIAYDNGS